MIWNLNTIVNHYHVDEISTLGIIAYTSLPTRMFPAVTKLKLHFFATQDFSD